MRTLSLRSTTARGSSVTPMPAATQPIMPSSVPSSKRVADGQPNSAKHLLEPLAIGAAGAEHQRGRPGLRRAARNCGEVLSVAP